jgi:EmrB/QacA subfamily drug resistance transporter
VLEVSTTNAGELAKSPSDNGLLALLCTAQFVLTLDFSIVNVALPTIQRELHFTAANLQWIVTGYALTFGSLLLLGGRAGDLFGRRKLLVAGLVLFAVASLTCGIAQSSLMLITSRIVQGIGGAMISPAALSLLTFNNPEGPARIRALGLWQAAAAGGASTGVVLGGLLVQYVDWRAIFLINIPIVAIMLSAIPRMLRHETPIDKVRLDYYGATTITLSIASLIYGLSYGEQHGFSQGATIVALIGFLVFGAAFPLVEWRSSAPMLPLSLLVSRTRRAALGTMIMVGAIVVAYVYFASLYLQRVLHFEPVVTGICFLPSTLVVMLTASQLTRRVLKRLGVKLTLISGLTSMAIGQFWLAHLAVHGTYGLNVLPGLLLTAFGMGLVFPTASIGATSDVVASEQGIAAGLLNTCQQVGSAMGLAVLATIASAVSKSSHHSLAAGFRASYLVATGLVVLTAIFVVLQLSGPQCQQEAARQRLVSAKAEPPI